jgi:ABC-type spermidine/putrescine transport system permease subunit II
MAHGLVRGVVVASVATAAATLLARTVTPVALLALLLLGRFVAAHGILALGITPGPTAAMLALIVDITPFAAMIVILRLRTRPVALLEAAADLGAGPWTRAWMVDWPHLRPALLAAWGWALLQTLGDVVAFELAGGGHSYTPGLLIRDALVREAAPGRALVAVLIVLALAMPCAVAIARELGSAEPIRSSPSVSPRWRTLGWLCFAALLLGPLVLWAGPQTEGLGPADRALAGLLGQTLAIAAIVAVLASVAGFALALATHGVEAAVITASVLAPLAIPPSVLGLLSLTAAARVGWPPGVTLTIVTLLGPALALAFVAARVLIGAIPKSLVDAAADLGADRRSRLRMLWLPLGRPAVLVTAALVFAWVLGQAAIPSFTSGPGGDTLAVALTVHARAGAIELVRRWSLILVVVSLGCAAAIWLAARAWRRS